MTMQVRMSMSTTTANPTLAQTNQSTSAAPSTTFQNGNPSMPHACPNCGTDLSQLLPHPQQIDPNTDARYDAQSAQSRIAELEAQVRLLTSKATAAVDKLADYEDQLHQLKSNRPAPLSLDSSASAQPYSMDRRALSSASDTALVPSHTHNASTGSIHDDGPIRPASAAATRTSILPSSIQVHNRLSSFLASSAIGNGSNRRTSPGPQQPPTPGLPSTPTAFDLQAALTRETTLRQSLASQLSQTESELEELSAAVFQEANEMVARERMAKSKLEQRLGYLEKRDAERGRRLDVLDGAVRRVQRVKGLLGHVELGGPGRATADTGSCVGER